MPEKTPQTFALPSRLTDALWEYSDLKGVNVDEAMAKALRNFLAREMGDDYGCQLERLDRFAGADREP